MIDLCVIRMNSSSEFLGRITQDPWFEVLLFIVAVAAIVLSIAFYFKSKRQREPTYSTRSYNVAQNISPARFESLILSYGETRIENFTVTKVLFWNSGRETIRVEDIAAREPLEIITEGEALILDANVIQRKPSTNGFEVRLSENQSSVELSFEYLDKDEGAVIQIVHTGTSGEDISMRGRIAGGGTPVFKEFTEESVPSIFRFFRRNISVSQYRKLFGIINIVMSINIFIFFWIASNEIEFAPTFLAFIFILMGASYLRKQIPSGFDAFSEEL